MLDWWYSLDITNINEAGQSPFDYSWMSEKLLKRSVRKKRLPPLSNSVEGHKRLIDTGGKKQKQVAAALNQGKMVTPMGVGHSRHPGTLDAEMGTWLCGQGQPRTQGETHPKPTHLPTHQPSNQEGALLPTTESIATSLLSSLP